MNHYEQRKPYLRLKEGMRVQVSFGAGLNSDRTGIIINADTGHRLGECAIKDTLTGETYTMFKSYLRIHKEDNK